MKANAKFLSSDKAEVGAAGLTALAGILITIIISAVIYYSVVSTGQFTEVTETNTDVVDSDTTLAWTLLYPPASTSEINLTIYNSTTGTGHGAASQYSLNGRVLTINTTTYNVTSLVITYYTSTGVLTRVTVNPMAGTVFGLWILVPLVVIGMFMIGLMVGRTAGKKGGL